MKKLELCPGVPGLKSSGEGRKITPSELGKYMKNRFAEINRRFANK